jgi:hypothetical protein
MLAAIELPAHEDAGEQRIAMITSFGQIRVMKLASALSAFIEPGDLSNGEKLPETADVGSDGCDLGFG